MFENSQKIYGSARHLARVAAVQAVYQMEQNPEDSQDVVNQFLHTRFDIDVKGTTKPDLDFFKEISLFLAKDLHVFDQQIIEQLSQQWTIERLPSLSRSILRCALYELIYSSAVPTPVIINEYLEVAKSFLEKKDVAFIHGTIDALSKKNR